jgi:hypothetical protein
MFQYGQLANASFAVQHQHSDGTWATMEREVEHHDPAEHDPEQEWQRGHVYVCTACEERIRVSIHEDMPPTG